MRKLFPVLLILGLGSGSAFSAGAECDVKIEVYGGKHSTLELLLSSAHPRQAGVLDGMVEVLSP